MFEKERLNYDRSMTGAGAGTPGTPTSTNTTTTSSSTSTSSRPRANSRDSTEGDGGSRPELDPRDCEMLQEYYEDNFAAELPPVMARMMGACMRGGMERQLIEMAIDETMLAPRPSPQYLMAILRRWRQDGIHTETARRADQERHEQQRARQGRKWEERGTQRGEERPAGTYDNFEFFDVVEEARRQRAT